MKIKKHDTWICDLCGKETLSPYILTIREEGGSQAIRMPNGSKASHLCTGCKETLRDSLKVGIIKQTQP